MAFTLTPEDIQKTSAEASKYADELDSLAKSNGVDTKIVGNDPAELLKAAGTGAATGAAIAAPISVAAGPFAPAVIAAAALIGAIASFLSKWHFGPTAEQKALAAEYDKINFAFHAILLTVPQPYRAQLIDIILAELDRAPGPFPFCLGGEPDAIKGEGGCVNTSIQGLRDAAQGLNQQVKDWIAKAQADAARTRRRRIGGVVAVFGLLTLGVYEANKRRGR